MTPVRRRLTTLSLPLVLAACATPGEPPKESRMPLSIDAIASVDPVHAETMRANPTDFTETRLPFYRRFSLVKATITLPSRPVVLEYAFDGASRVILIAGSASDIYAINRADSLALTPDTAVDYLTFFLSRVHGQRVVTSAASIAWLSAADEAGQRARSRAEQLIAPPTVEATPTGFLVTAFVIDGTTLTRVSSAVTFDGEVTGEATPMVEGLPVPTVL